MTPCRSLCSYFSQLSWHWGFFFLNKVNASPNKKKKETTTVQSIWPHIMAVQMHCGNQRVVGSKQVCRSHRVAQEIAPSETPHWNLARLLLPAPVFIIILFFLSVQKTQRETPGSFLRRTQPEGLQHQRIWPHVQISFQAPVQPPVPKGTPPAVDDSFPIALRCLRCHHFHLSWKRGSGQEDIWRVT